MFANRLDVFQGQKIEKSKLKNFDSEIKGSDFCNRSLCTLNSNGKQCITLGMLWH